ncbi:MAG: bifunctional phosphoribosyl-AMP cyclohydrolase/phosphoribosyl-ATP diphosphatase HisIE [Flavobacteriales bacterium]|nr:bifunctional phosphoribosyl-AMP cyclohydrolase/phosphoribosyl-ATP diphosphatase HisIE [Flavobacteriales bacterium]
MKIDFEKGDGLVPTIVQDARTKEVQMLGYMNQEALERTLDTGLVTFFSRSKNRLWTKGETSGNHLKLVSMKEDCDNDTILVQAIPVGPTCHKGDDTCFGNSPAKGFIYELESIIEEKKGQSPEESYTSYLFEKGINKIAQKVGEEAIEVVIEAKDDDVDLFKGEAADLLYHFLVLLKAKNLQLSDIEQVLKHRNSKE